MRNFTHILKIYTLTCIIKENAFSIHRHVGSPDWFVGFLPHTPQPSPPRTNRRPSLIGIPPSGLLLPQPLHAPRPFLGSSRSLRRFPWDSYGDPTLAVLGLDTDTESWYVGIQPGWLKYGQDSAGCPAGIWPYIQPESDWMSGQIMARYPVRI